LIGFRQRTGHHLIAAEVIARDSSGWWQTVRLDRGRNDGVTEDLAVVTPDGLAGRVLEVSDRTADVLLISDPACRVAVRIPRTGSNGVLTGMGVRWNGQVICRIDFINRNHPIRPGDEVVTSGLGGVLPPELPVGYIETIETDAAGLYHRAEVLPRADIARMRRAFVLKPVAGDRTP
jgi:rod shape-determining protein MreC